jgi:hypothetical protein
MQEIQMSGGGHVVSMLMNGARYVVVAEVEERER